jgi:hypothetical protein
MEKLAESLYDYFSASSMKCNEFQNLIEDKWTQGLLKCGNMLDIYA